MLLRTAGLSYANVVAARVFLTDDSFFEAMNDEYGRYFSDGAAGARDRRHALDGRRQLGRDLAHRVGVGEAAHRSDGLAEPAGLDRRPRRPRVFLSGVLGNTDANVGDLVAQTHEVLTRIKRTLDLAGLSFVDVVDSTVYLPDLWQYDRMDQIYREAFLTPPARSTVGAKLVTRAGLVEFMVTAVK